MDNIKLTQYSHGAGCGCKISAEKLEEILKPEGATKNRSPLLVVGNENKDDAAVYDLEDGTCVISTTDFFTPIVDDPFVYGGIASSNAISDIYAMGGRPLVAVAILGWPIDKIPLQVAKKVLAGGRSVCEQADILIAGGHSIDTLEPIFGLAVTGRAPKKNIKLNSKAKAESALYLTKPLGVGILTTAQKKGKMHEPYMQMAVDSMLTLNKFGVELGTLHYVNAMTDVTGFGLLGHLGEICEGSNLSAEIEFDKIPVFDFLDKYMQPENIPGGTRRNWNSYAHKVCVRNQAQKWILADPQTSGGLLISVDIRYTQQFERVAATHNMILKPFGWLTKKQKKLIVVNE